MLIQSVKMSKVKLNWATSSAQLLVSLKQIWTDDGFSNITLTFEDESEIKTNRTLLAALSPVMRNFLKQGKETQNSQIFMFGIESSIMKALLEFIFTEEICIEQERLDLFFSTASKLKVNGFTAEDNKKEHVEKSEHDGLNHQDILRQDICLTMEETNPFDYDSADFEIDEAQKTHEEVIQQNQLTNIDPGKDLYRNIQKDVQSQINNTSMKVDEEIVNDKRGISCFICKAAGKLDHDRFPTMDDLTQHEKESHTRDKSPVYSCEKCGLEFHKLIVLNQHKRKEHPENTTRGSVICDVCGRSYKTKDRMEKHRDYSHPIPGKLFKCRMPNCPKESMTKNASNVHYYQAHPEKQRKEFEGKL